MPWGALLSLGGSLLQSGSASNAGASQAAATNAATAENGRQYDRNIAIEQQRYDQNRSDRAPYMGAGRNALAQYMREMGLPYQQGGTTGGNPITALSRDQIRSQLLGQFTKPGQSGPVYDSNSGNTITDNPYPNQPTPSTVDEAGLNAAIDKQFNSQSSGQASQPWQDQTTAPQDVQLDPGYQFGLDQGQMAIDRKTAAAGGRVSGAALKAAAEYGTNYATTGYSAAYGRRQDRLNRLATLAGYGNTPASSSTGQQPNNGNAALISSQGNATGAAQLAQGNIWGNAANQFASTMRTNPVSSLYADSSSIPMQPGGGY